MNLAVISAAKPVIAKGAFQLKRYAPEILTGVGIAAVGCGTVLACKATLDAHEIVDKYNEEIDIIEQAHEKEPVLYPVSKVRTAKVEQIVQAGLGFCRLYGPSILLLAGGIAAILGGHGILRRRNAALALAYTGLNETFLAYRERVKGMLGDGADQEFMTDIVRNDISVTDDDGNEHVLEGVKEVADTDRNKTNPYTRWYDENNAAFSQDPGTNIMTLRQRLTYLQNKQIAQGYLLFNDVLKDLDYKPTSIGAVNGWVYDGSDESLINFGPGIEDLLGDNPNHDPEIAKAKRAFMASPGKSMYLEFNVQGPVYQLIDTIIAHK